MARVQEIIRATVGSRGGSKARAEPQFAPVWFFVLDRDFSTEIATRIYTRLPSVPYKLASVSLTPLQAWDDGGEFMASLATLRERVSAPDRRYFIVKRVTDVAIASILLLFLLPVMAIVAITIVLETPGPVLFMQRRIGHNGLPFDMLKFRSMRHNSDSSVHQQAIKRYMQGERLNTSRTTDAPFKLGDDPRITQVGRFIRKTSLDELPQLWNVLRGDMSLVGPRPPVPYEVELYDQRAMRRLEGKPGLTGLWQVYGRGTVNFDEMIDMDLKYLTNRSIWYDLKLIALTAPAALRGRGAV